ncbi:MAG: hypothetical protein GQ574_05370 [Crocinitomix sp.]|nr:hypothetical protein [Crocinitomix sp.]
MFATIALMAVSCNKNQAAVKKLDGTWKATSINYTEDGVTVDILEAGFITSATYVFDGCKLKNDEFCNLTTTFVTSLGTNTSTDVYNVINDGVTLQVKDEMGSTDIWSKTIDELTSTKLVITELEPGAGSTVSTFEKQ